jgi:hypothetical protein
MENIRGLFFYLSETLKGKKWLKPLHIDITIFHPPLKRWAIETNVISVSTVCVHIEYKKLVDLIKRPSSIY